MVCKKCQSVISDDSKFCSVCGQVMEISNGQQAVNYQPISNSTPSCPSPAQVYAPIDNANVGGGVQQNVCPRCGSAYLHLVSEISTSGKDVSSGRACCGYILLGPVGILCGFCGKGKQTKTTHSWVCSYCGHRWVV